jgi:hypothetical protein
MNAFAADIRTSCLLAIAADRSPFRPTPLRGAVLNNEPADADAPPCCGAEREID